MVGGDFNAVINPALDKSQSDTTANPSSKLQNKFITELNLIDLWRIQNTKAKDFTFFSNSQVKSSHLYLYSTFNNTNCVKATAQYQNGKIVSIM